MASSALQVINRALTGGKAGDEARRHVDALIASRDRAREKAQEVESAPAKIMEDGSLILGAVLRGGVENVAQRYGLRSMVAPALPFVAAAGYGGGWMSGSNVLRRSSLAFGLTDLTKLAAGPDVAKEQARECLADEIRALEARINKPAGS